MVNHRKESGVNFQEKTLVVHPLLGVALRNQDSNPMISKREVL